MGPDDETGFIEHPSRARRAKALGTLSLIAVAVASILYIKPSFGATAAPPAQGAPPRTGAFGYQLDSVDFVDPSDGWVLADLGNATFTVLGTTNAGRRWTTRLTAPSSRPAEFMRFFDRSSGVVVTTGPNAMVFTTRDGGSTWTNQEVGVTSYVIAASFVDAAHGWLLDYGGTNGSTQLFMTADGGGSWRMQGSPVSDVTQAYAVTFADRTHGWLDTVAPGPYAYATTDGGEAWMPVALPAPPGGWPVPHGSFFVAARPTLGGGVIVTVVNSQHINGRNAAGTAVLSYPPLTVRTFDGGSPVEYVYSTFVDSTISGVLRANNKPGPATYQVQPANQIGFRSLDGGATWSPFAPPTAGGTIGYADAVNWWWAGPGVSRRTTDGGQTWSPPLSDPISTPLPGSLIVLDPAHAWICAVADGGPILFTTADGGTSWVEVRLPALTS